MSLDRGNLKSITNSFQDVRLVSLREWPDAPQIMPRDHGGPYMVGQEGYHPEDPNYDPDEFVLSKGGKWISLGDYFKLPQATRVKEFIFGTAAEVMHLIESLPSHVMMWGKDDQKPGAQAAGGGDDQLKQAYKTGEKRPLQDSTRA